VFGVAELVVELLNAVVDLGLHLGGQLDGDLLPLLVDVEALFAHEADQNEYDEDVHHLPGSLGCGCVDEGGLDVELLGHLRGSQLLYRGELAWLFIKIEMLDEDDSMEQRHQMIHGIEPRRSKAKSEYLPRRTERLIKTVPLRKESSGGLTKIATTNIMVIVAVAFFTVSCFYFYVGRA
jgi:hypothetical protein